jgi:multiple sugar transport system substrate-binding protein
MRLVLFVCLILVMATAASAKTTIEWWQFMTDPAVRPTIMQMVDEFEATHPDVTVKVTDLTWANGHEKIVLALSSGTGPDVLELGSDWIAQFADNGNLLDISKDIEKDSAGFQGWSMATYQGKVYAYPWFLGTRVLFANADLLERAHYPRDAVPITLVQFRQMAYKIGSLGPDIYGWGSNTAEKHRLYKKFLPFFWSFGARIFTPDDEEHLSVVSSTMAVEAMRFYKALHDSTGYVDTQRGIEDAFLDGKIGFILSGDWLLKRILNEKRDFPLVSTLFPGQKYTGKSFLGGEFLAVSSASEHPDQAREFIEFITSPENQVRFCKANRSANPSSREAQKDKYFTSNVHLQTFIRQINMAEHPPVDPNWVYIEDIIESAIEKVLFGDGDLIAQPLYQAGRKMMELEQEK